MSDSLIRLLGRFTPDASGLDRDALLFAAGRASARTAGRWKVLAAALLVAELLTVALLWPRPAPAGPSPDRVIPSQEPPLVPGPVSSDPWALITIRDRALQLEGDLQSPAGAELLAPSQPAFTAFTPASTLFQ